MWRGRCSPPSQPGCGTRSSFELRVALVPVSEIRAQGHDVRIARFAASPDVSYAMFSGGGLAYAERRMKEGAFAIPPAPPGTMPDLSGLTCRFDEIMPERGVILSLIVLPGAEADPAAFNALIGKVLALAEEDRTPGGPLPEHGPAPAIAVQGLRDRGQDRHGRTGCSRPRLRRRHSCAS